MIQLTITYDGNRLVKVTDNAEALNYNGALDFNDGDDSTCEYDYDSNGTLTRDGNRGIKGITYDYSHYPNWINMNIGKRQRNIRNDYTPDGRKLSSITKITVSNAGGNTIVTTTDQYVDGLILRNAAPLMWRHDGGYVELDANGTPTGWNYYVTDHLGSTRMVVDSNDSIRETISYYPFGSEMRMENPALLTNDLNHPFRFTGKELVRLNGLNMYDFGARWYDVAGVPMWTSVDPLAEKYYNVSPYTYCAGNPVNRIDPDGKDDYYTPDGQFLFRDNKETDYIIIRDPYLYFMQSIGAEWINADTPIENADISAEAYSAIYTDILKKAGFNTDKLLNGQISIVKLKDNTAGGGSQYEADGFYNHKAIIPYADADVARCMNVDGIHQVTAYCHPLGDANRGYLSTVSNVVNIIGVHEFECHGEKRMNSKQHWKILQRQREHNSWNKVTPQLKNLYRYLETNKIDNYSRPR
jgi:RHS repeat-associated protein